MVSTIRRTDASAKLLRICGQETPYTRSVAILRTSTTICGRPSGVSLAFAFRSPAFTRSTIRERSSSSKAPRNVNTNLLAGVHVSRCSDKETNLMRWALKVWRARSRWLTERGKRSNLQTTIASKWRRCAPYISLSSSGRRSFVPLIPISTYSPATVQPWRSAYSRSSQPVTGAGEQSYVVHGEVDFFGEEAMARTGGAGGPTRTHRDIRFTIKVAA
jgi:hypothetical protein